MEVCTTPRQEWRGNILNLGSDRQEWRGSFLDLESCIFLTAKDAISDDRQQVWMARKKVAIFGW